jgi:YidC/Oxa1 family membrane protein insertase
MQKVRQFLFIFIITWLILTVFGVGQKPPVYQDDIVLFADKKYSVGSSVAIEVLNNTNQNIEISQDCSVTPLITEKYSNGAWQVITEQRKNKEGNCINPVVIAPSVKHVFSYANESFKLFGEIGKYRMSIPYNNKTFSHEFETTAPGFFKTLWNSFVYKPLYNLLIWLVETVPGYSLGLSIILLTIIVKIILLLPNHKALKSQKALQKFQPELQKIKDKYKGDQAKIAQETMALWKKHKINPAGSCLPILLQFPFLMAIFFILQDGLSEDSIYYLYDALKDFNYTLIETDFLTMNLSENGPLVLALLIGFAQFIQMKISFAHLNKKKSDVVKKGEKTDVMALQMNMMNKMFTYVMPVLVGVFTLTFPAGVGIYWGVSTLFAIVQQQFVNKLMK